MPTNHENPHAPDPEIEKESAKLGYEISDIDAGSVSVFIGGLFGFVIIFFFFCYLMGKVINTELEKQDGKTDKWHQQNDIFAGALANGGKREDLKSNAAMQQQELGAMTKAFPNPRLETDDGNEDTAELHSREDLLLDHYSSVPGQPLRIPIDRAMQLIAAKGLPVSAAAAQPGMKLAKDDSPVVTAPLTDGFARTGYELQQMEAREQKMEDRKPETSAEHAELKPVK